MCAVRLHLHADRLELLGTDTMMSLTLPFLRPDDAAALRELRRHEAGVRVHTSSRLQFCSGRRSSAAGAAEARGQGGVSFDHPRSWTSDSDTRSWTLTLGMQVHQDTRRTRGPGDVRTHPWTLTRLESEPESESYRERTHEGYACVEHSKTERVDPVNASIPGNAACTRPRWHEGYACTQRALRLLSWPQPPGARVDIATVLLMSPTLRTSTGLSKMRVRGLSSMLVGVGTRLRFSGFRVLI
eukprot:350677-Chlamydomonas_euryale.AAC.2